MMSSKRNNSEILTLFNNTKISGLHNGLIQLRNSTFVKNTVYFI